MKVLKTALLFLMCVSFSFSCKEGVKEVRVLKLAHGLSPSHSVHLGLLYMNERPLEHVCPTLAVAVAVETADVVWQPLG